MENARDPHHPLTAREAGLVGCTVCMRVSPQGAAACPRCGASLSSRDGTSIQRVWAWLAAGLVAYVPANTYPMLVTTTLGSEQRNTLLGGVLELYRYGSWGVASIVLVASIMIPITKFLSIAYLAIWVGRRHRSGLHGRHRLYEVVEFIGRWSMIDVFVVAILSALVQLGSAANVHPGVAAVSFALSVAFTMLAAESFDSRLIWDADKEGRR